MGIAITRLAKTRKHAETIVCPRRTCSSEYRVNTLGLKLKLAASQKFWQEKHLGE